MGLGSSPEVLPRRGEMVPAGGSGRSVSKALDTEKTVTSSARTRKRGVLGVRSAREGGGYVFQAEGPRYAEGVLARRSETGERGVPRSGGVGRGRGGGLRGQW